MGAIKVIGQSLLYLVGSSALCWLALLYQWVDYALVAVGWSCWFYFVYYVCDIAVEEGNCAFATLWFTGFKMLGVTIGILSMTLFRYQYLEWTERKKCQSACCPWTRALPLVKHWSLAFNIFEAALADLAETSGNTGTVAGAHFINFVTAVLIVVSQSIEYYKLGRVPRRMVIVEGWGKAGWDSAPSRKGTKLPMLPEEEKKRLGISTNSDGEYVYDGTSNKVELTGPSVQYWPLSTLWFVAYTMWNMAFMSGYMTGWSVKGSMLVANIPTMMVPALAEFVNPGTWAMVRAQSIVPVYILSMIIRVSGPKPGKDDIIAYGYYSAGSHMALSLLGLLLTIALLVRNFMEYRALGKEEALKAAVAETDGGAKDDL